MFACFIAVILADSSFKIFMAIDSAVAARFGWTNSLFGLLLLSSIGSF